MNSVKITSQIKSYAAFIGLVFIVFVLSSCSDKIKRSLPNVAAAEMQETLATAHPDFRDGWNDGCEVGTSSGANSFYKSIYKSNKVDGYRVTESDDYKAGWNAAFWFCYRYQYVKNKSSMWNSFQGGYK